MDAQAFVNKLLFSKETEHRQIKVADRHCTLEVSSQAALMKELFPKAKNVEWNGQVPVISQPGPEVPFNSGFKCFISREELLTLAKHAESPHRVSLSDVLGVPSIAPFPVALSSFANTDCSERM